MDFKSQQKTNFESMKSFSRNEIIGYAKKKVSVALAGIELEDYPLVRVTKTSNSFHVYFQCNIREWDPESQKISRVTFSSSPTGDEILPKNRDLLVSISKDDRLISRMFTPSDTITIFEFEEYWDIQVSHNRKDIQ